MLRYDFPPVASTAMHTDFWAPAYWGMTKC